MADWYVSNPIWSALPQWQASHTYSLGDIVRPLTAFTTDNECAFVITTAGTSGGSEPSWNTANNGNTSDNGMVWQNVSGQSAYAWTAPAGSLGTITAGYNINRRYVGGDRVFIDSTHAETNAIAQTLQAAFNFPTPVLYYSVNASGSVPPTGSDYTVGASISFVNGANPNPDGNNFFYGITFANTNIFLVMDTLVGIMYLKDCTIQQNASSSGATIQFDNPGHVIFDNTQIIPSTSAGYLVNMNYQCTFEWINTPNATNGLSPNSFAFTSSQPNNILHLKGLDLTAITSTSVSGLINVNNAFLFHCLIENCYLGTAPIAVNFPTSGSGEGPIVEIVNSYNGNENYNNQRFTIQGALTTDTSTVVSGGATDGTTPFSHKIISNSTLAGPDGYLTIDGFPIYINNTSTGTSHTASVEIISSSTLNNNDIWLELDYFDSSSSPISTATRSASPLATASPVPSSAATWLNQPSTPVAQKLEATFTASQIGLIRGIVRLTKPSTTVWYDPSITIS